MKQTVLKADLRTDSPKKTRASGFIPGVLHGPGTQSRSVQFERSSFIRILAKHGSNAKVWVELGKEKNFGIFKEIQRDPLDKSIIHATIHLVSQDQELKMLVPLVYTGREDLENRILMIQTIKEHVEMSGKAASIPESIVVDISAKELGDSVTVADMQLPKGVRILEADDEIFAIIKGQRSFGSKEESETSDEQAESAEESVEPAVTPAKS